MSFIFNNETMNWREKWIFSIAIFLHFSFFGFLSIQLAIGIHSSLISLGFRAIIAALALYLVLISISKNQYPKLNYCSACYFMYLAVMFVMLIIYSPSQGYFGYGYEYGKLVNYGEYVYFIIIPTLLFYMPASRLNFLSENTHIIFFASLCSVIVILYAFGGILSSDYSTILTTGTGINRSTIKQPIGYLYIFSLYWLIFPNKLWKFIFGGIGMAVSTYATILSTSQSLILSDGTTFVVALLLSIKRKASFLRAIFVACGTVVVILPKLMNSRGWERLSQFVFVKEHYMYNDGYDTSRIDLMKEGLSLFLDSPIVGGNLLNPRGGTCHCIFVDALMSGGIVAFILLLIYFLGCAKGALILSKSGERYYWIIMFAAYMLIQEIFHGGYYSVAAVPFILLMCIFSLNFNSRNHYI